VPALYREDAISLFSIICQANRWDTDIAYLSSECRADKTFVAGAHLTALSISTVSAPSDKAKTAKGDAAKQAISLFDDFLSQAYPTASVTSGALEALRRRLLAAGMRSLVLDPVRRDEGGRIVQLGQGPAPNWSISVSESGHLLAHDLPPPPQSIISCSQSDVSLSQPDALQSSAAFGRTKEAAYDTAAYLLGAGLRLPDVLLASRSRPEFTETRTQLQDKYVEMLGASELYTFRQAVVVTNNDALIAWWVDRFLRSACATGHPVLSLDSEGEWQLLQLAHASSTLVTSNCRHPLLVALLERKDVRFVGKDLANDRILFALHALGSNDAALSTASLNWCDLTELLPFWRCDCSCSALCQYLLGRPFGWKALINHQNSSATPPWAFLQDLQAFEVFYAAADACFVVDCLTTLAETQCHHSSGIQIKHLLPPPPPSKSRSVGLSALHCPNGIQCGPFSLFACLAGLSNYEAAAAYHTASGLGELCREEGLPGWNIDRLRNLLGSQGCGLVLLRDVDFPDGGRTIAVFVTPIQTDSFTECDWVLVREAVTFGHCTLAHLEAVLVPPSVTSDLKIQRSIPRGPLSPSAAHELDIPRCLCTDFAAMLEVLSALSVSNFFDYSTFALPRGWQCGGDDLPPNDAFKTDYDKVRQTCHIVVDEQKYYIGRYVDEAKASAAATSLYEQFAAGTDTDGTDFDAALETMCVVSPNHTLPAPHLPHPLSLWAAGCHLHDPSSGCSKSGRGARAQILANFDFGVAGHGPYIWAPPMCAANANPRPHKLCATFLLFPGPTLCVIVPRLLSAHTQLILQWMCSSWSFASPGATQLLRRLPRKLASWRRLPQ
jgi:hypothetical protein